MATSADVRGLVWDRPEAATGQRWFGRYAWFVLAYNIAVVLWGTLVRATGSGAGCGDHWPLCNGTMLPELQQMKTAIEFTHRAMSGISLILVMGLVLGAFRLFPKRHPVRRASILSLVFILTEALIGAGLVLFNLVAKNASLTRAFSLSIHLVNTLILLGAMALTAWWASGKPDIRWRKGDPGRWAILAGLLGAMLLGVSGAIAALGDTLFPATSFAEGLRQEFSSAASILLRLRVIHPALAVIVGSFLMGVASWGLWGQRERSVRIAAGSVIGLTLIQLGTGVLDVWLLAPLWLQIVHLLLADLVWVAFVLFAAGVLGERHSEAALPMS